MYDSDRPGLLLYLINVLEPIPVSRLQNEYNAAVRAHKRGKRRAGTDFRSLLSQLHRNQLIVRRGNSYSVTPAGIQKVRALGLGRIRDKNRLLLLNKSL